MLLKNDVGSSKSKEQEIGAVLHKSERKEHSVTLAFITVVTYERLGHNTHGNHSQGVRSLLIPHDDSEGRGGVVRDAIGNEASFGVGLIVVEASFFRQSGNLKASSETVDEFVSISLQG